MVVQFSGRLPALETVRLEDKSAGLDGVIVVHSTTLGPGAGGCRLWHYPDLDQAYREPPRSTRQLLHPEQYWVGGRREAPQPLTLPDLSKVLGPGWSKATEGSIGELGLAVLTGARVQMDSPEVLLPARWTNRASAGILADLYQHYVSGEKRVTVLATRWETTDDAQEFDAALVHRSQRFFRMGCNVLLLAGDVGDQAEALAIAALQGVRYFPPE